VIQVRGAVVRKPGFSFALMIVEESVLDSPFERARAVAWGSLFFRVPTVLVSERGHRTFGRDDIVSRLRCVDIMQIPWLTYPAARR
jgi:hypothetical protein